MPVTVFAGPDPDTILNALLGRTPLRNGPVCAVVPDARSVSALERKLAEVLGGAFTGHRVFTLEGLARAVLSTAGPVPDTFGGHIRRTLVGELSGSRIGAKSRFAGLAVYPGFAGLIGSWLEDTRSGDAPASADHELHAIAGAYESHLRRLGVTDHEGWISLALDGEIVDRFAESIRGTFILHGFSDLTSFQMRFISRIMDSARRSAATLLYDLARPELFALPGRLLERFREQGARIVEVPPSFAPGTGTVLRGFRGGEYAGEVEPETVQIHTFRNAESEADWVAGTIRAGLAAGDWTLGEIMVAARFRPGFGSPLFIALRRNGIPVESGIPRPLAHHPVVRFVLRAIEASIYPDREELIREVRRSAYTGLEYAGGLELDDRGWDCMVEVGSPDDFVLSVRKMLDFLRVSDHLDGGGDPARATSENLAYVRLGELLDEFSSFYTPFRRSMHAVEFDRLFRQFIEDVFLPDAPSPGRGVIVTDVNQARHVSRPVVFIIGTDGRSFPMRSGGFTLHEPGYALLRRERADREEPLLFYSAMQGARRLFLTFPGIDDEGRDSTLSPYVREILDQNAAWARTRFHHGVSGAAWKGGCPTRLGQAESLLRELKPDDLRAPALLSQVDAGAPALSALLRKSIGTYIGLVDDRGGKLTTPYAFEAIRRDWGDARIFSVTDLERYAACPLRFFFERMLRLGIDHETPGELDPADRGTIIHEILARFYRERIARGNPGFDGTSLASRRTEMRDVCRRVLAERSEAFRDMHTVVAAAEKEFILSWMDAFLEREATYYEQESFRPAFLEVDFGRSREGNPAYPPLPIGEGDGAFLLGGRIDRIDLDLSWEIPSVRVIDYKTGERRAALTALEAGRDLQLALYLKAAAESIVPGSAVHDGVFYSLKDMEFSAYKHNRKPLTGEDWDEYIRVAVEKAVEVVAGIRGGRFPAGECPPNGYCDFRPLCRGGRDTSEEGDDADS